MSYSLDAVRETLALSHVQVMTLIAEVERLRAEVKQLRAAALPVVEPQTKRCPGCRGLGRVNGGDVENSTDWERCSMCRGKGVLTAVAPAPPLTPADTQEQP